jgi:hypothetical protein
MLFRRSSYIDLRQSITLLTLTRLDDVSEETEGSTSTRDLDRLIVLKNLEVLEEVYGIPIIVTFVLIFFSASIYNLNFVYIPYSAFPCLSHVCIE